MGDYCTQMIKKDSLTYESRAGDREGMPAVKVHATVWEPSADIRAVLIIAHGMAEYIGRYDDFASYLAERGILVAGCDYLGHGETVVGFSKYGYFCPYDPATVIVRDVYRLRKILAEKYPDKPQIIMGHSMGSFVVRNYLCRYGKEVDGAILMGSGMPPRSLVLAGRFLANCQTFFGGAGKAGQLLNKMIFGGYNKKIAGAERAFSWLSFNSANVEKYEADPLCGFVFTVNGFQTLFELICRLYKPKNIAGIPTDLNILMVSGAFDPVGGYGKAHERIEAGFNKAGIYNITSKLYPWGRHEILHEDEKAEVYTDILNWIDALIK